MRLTILCLIIWFLPFGGVNAQVCESKTFTTLDGLPSNRITSLFKDSRGILWIGTEVGLAKLEGGKIARVLLPNSELILNCWTIVEDNQHHLWFGTYGNGVYYFDGISWEHFSKQSGLNSDYVRKLFATDKLIYIGTDNGISTISANRNSISVILKPNHKDNPYTITDFLSIQNKLYVTTLHHGIHKLDSVSLKAPLTSSSSEIISTYTTNKNTYFSSKLGIRVQTSQDFVLGNFSDKKIGKTAFWGFQETDSLLYAVGWGIYNQSGGLFEISDSNCVSVNEKYGISTVDLTSIAFLKEQNYLYAGSKTKGLIQVDLNCYIQSSTLPFTTSQDIIDIDNLGHTPYFLTQDGVTKTSDVPRTLSPLLFKQYQEKQLRNRTDALPIRYNGFFELDYETPTNDIEFNQIRSAKNHIWVSSNIGLFELDSMLNFKTYIPTHTFVFNLNQNGNVIEAIPYNSVRVYISKKESEAYLFPADKIESPKNILDIISIKNKTYFATIFKGLFKYENGEIRSYLADSTWDEAKLRFLAKTDNGNLVVSSEFGDVFIINDSADFKIVQTISNSQIQGTTITFLNTYKSTILIGTEEGLNIYKNGKMIFINKENGLNFPIFTSSTIIDSILYIGTVSGYYKVNLEGLLRPVQQKTSLFISKILVNHQAYAKHQFKWFRFTDSILTLSHDQNTIHLFLHPDGFKFPDKLKFRYRIDNKSNWSQFSAKPEIFLPYLSDGQFDIQVEVLDLNSGSTHQFNLTHIYIKPPFHKTWWFYVFLSIIMFFIGLGLNRWRVIAVRKEEKFKAELQHKLDISKMEALLSQMNPHFIFNAINSIQSYIIGNDKEAAMMYLNDFATLIRQTLHNSYSLDISLENEIIYLKNYIKIENLRFDNQIKVNWDICENVDIDNITIPSMILQPFIENVFEHAFKPPSSTSKLSISIEYEGVFLKIIIQDNGVGFNETTQPKELHGMIIAKKRLSIISKNKPHHIQVSSVPNKGTTITILFHEG